MFTCPGCNEIGVESTDVVEREETFPVRGEATTVLSNIRVCTKCGEEVYDEELDSANLERAYALYRSKHKSISPTEISTLREYYGLTQRSLSALLGLGEITIHRYENGSIPDEAHNQLLRFVQDPWNMQALVVEHGDRLNASQRSKLQSRLKDILNQETPDKLVKLVSAVAERREPNSFSGFRCFASDALMEMMVFFAAKPGGVYKTKLNKLLWYSECEHFRRHSTSISGTTYVHVQHGPVADQYEFYLCHLQREDSIVVEEVFFDSGSGENLRAQRPARSEVFSPSEIEAMESVYHHFRDHSSKEISDLSHDEEGYQKTQMRQPISFQFAELLKHGVKP